MRFLSYALFFIIALSTVPSFIRAQYDNDDNNIIHMNGVSIPFIIADTTTNDNNNALIDHDINNEDNTPIISSLISSPMLIADNNNNNNDNDIDGESLIIDYQNDNKNSINLFTTINEELNNENDIESLLETMDTEDMMIASAATTDDDTNDNNDDIDTFDIMAENTEGISKSDEAEKESSLLKKELKEEKLKDLKKELKQLKLKKNEKRGLLFGRRRDLLRSLPLRHRSPFRRLRTLPICPYRDNCPYHDTPSLWREIEEEREGKEYSPRREKRLHRMLKLMVLSKKLKALDMKMNLMKLLSRAIKMRMMEKRMEGGDMGDMIMRRSDRSMLLLKSMHNKMIKKLMILKMIKLMHLLYQSTLGLPVYHRSSGIRLSSRYLLRHLLRHTLRYPILGKILLGLKIKSIIMKSIMKSFLNNLKYLLKKIFLLKKKSLMKEGNRHRLYVKADRAIVNVGDGNEFKPIFYRSRAAPRISIDDSAIPVRIHMPEPTFIRRMAITGRHA